MARGTSAGTGRVSISDKPKGPRPTAMNDKEASVSKAPVPTNQSQRTTTPPSVKQPPIIMVTNTTPRTARESRLDAYLGSNLSKPGGDQTQTALERQYGMIAKGDGYAGTEPKMIGRPKQAQ